jgi:hypothetical protein
MGGEISERKDPRFLLNLTRRGNQCLDGTGADGDGLSEGLCAEGRMGRLEKSRISRGAQVIPWKRVGEGNSCDRRKGGIFMKKILFQVVLLSLALGAFGCTGLEPIETREAIYGKASPLIHKSYAATQIWPGDTWKVYLIASDPDGDMKNLVCTIDQPGVGVYPVSLTRIAEGHRKEISGYLHLNTMSFESLTFVTLNLTVQVQDMAGHYSQPAAFSLLLSPYGQQEPPPPGVFQEVNLGPIMIRLRTIHEDLGSPFDRGILFRGPFR